MRVTPVCHCLHLFSCEGIWLRRESLRHILASRWYAPETIAVNVTWMERGFNACQTHRSMCPSIFNRLRAIARYWSKIAIFFYPHPLAFNAPVGVVLSVIPGKCFVPIKLQSWGYQAVNIDWAVSTQYQCVTDRQTDVQPIAITCVSLLTYVNKWPKCPCRYQTPSTRQHLC